MTKIKNEQDNAVQFIDQITTQRLFIRPLNLNDAPSIYSLFNQADCLHYIGDKGINDHQAAIDYLNTGPLQSYQEHQMGLMAVTLRSGEFVGTCGLLVRPQFEHPDLGFAFLSEHQGKGYAKEASVAVLSAHQGIKTIISFTHLDNNASQQLLKSLGFTQQDNIVFDGQQEQSAYFVLKQE